MSSGNILKKTEFVESELESAGVDAIFLRQSKKFAVHIRLEAPMVDIFSPAILLYIIPGACAAIGGVLAYNRGRNPLLWGVCSALVPICIMIVWYEKPKKEVAGHFRKCCCCREWIKWKESPCRYCGTEQ